MTCPVCRGSKLRYNPDTNSWGPQSCPACEGTGQGPTGRRMSDDTVQRMNDTRQEHGAHAANQHVPWTPEEDAMALSAEKAWRRKGKYRRPGDWFAHLAERLHAEYPSQPLRTPMAVKQRIIRLYSLSSS